MFTRYSIKYYTVFLDLASFGLASFGLASFGLASFGLACFGLGCFGVAFVFGGCVFEASEMNLR